MPQPVCIISSEFFVITSVHSVRYKGVWVVGGCTYLLGIAYSVISGFLYYAQTFYCKGYLRIQEENIYPVQQVPVHPQECEDIFVQQLVYIPKK